MRPKWSEGLVEEELDGQSIIFHIASQKVHVLNTSAAMLWPFFDGQVTTAELAIDLADALTLPLDRAQRDVDELVRQLVDLGLLVAGGSAAP